MPVRIITISFNPEAKLFQDEDFLRWLINKRVIRQEPAFFQLEGKPYWSVFVEYEVLLTPEEQREPTVTLPAKESALLERLRTWRREKSDKERLPAFVIATNSHLEQVVKALPTTMEALRQINGFGLKKTERHGREIIEIIKASLAKDPPPPEVTPATTTLEASHAVPFVTEATPSPEPIQQ
ncbi:MAG: HRDC domain-containing protein [Magnetococcus sp. YQC-5]